MMGGENMDDPNAPATKGDIQQLRTEMKGDFQQLRQVDLKQLRTEMNHQFNDLVERISDSETKLLQAFYTYAESNSKRVAAIEDGQRRTQEPAFDHRRTPHRRGKAAQHAAPAVNYLRPSRLTCACRFATPAV
jgi:hypothetical protein